MSQMSENGELVSRAQGDVLKVLVLYDQPSKPHRYSVCYHRKLKKTPVDINIEQAGTTEF